VSSLREQRAHHDLGLAFSLVELRITLVPRIPEDRHTIWLAKGGWTKSLPARYALSDEGLVVFGDRGQFAELADGDQATATIRAVADGPAVESFPVTVNEVQPGAVDHDALLELVADVPLGNNPMWVNIRLDELASSRRFLVLKP
jgi:hypothetical protein